MTYDELGTLAARGHGIVWDSKESTGTMGMWVALTQQGPTGFAGWQPRVQGVSQCWHLATEYTGVLGRQMMGCRKQTAVPEGVPRDQLGSLRRCQQVLLPVWWLPRSLCSSLSAIWSSSQASVPTPAWGNAAGCEVGSGTPEAVLSHPDCSLATHLPQLQDLLCCYFLGVPGQGWLGGGTLATDSCTPLTSVSPAFEPPLPC